MSGRKKEDNSPTLDWGSEATKGKDLNPFADMSRSKESQTIRERYNLTPRVGEAPIEAEPRSDAKLIDENGERLLEPDPSRILVRVANLDVANTVFCAWGKSAKGDNTTGNSTGYPVFPSGGQEFRGTGAFYVAAAKGTTARIAWIVERHAS